MLSLKYLIHCHLLNHQSSSWTVSWFSHQEVPQTMLPITWRLYHENILCNLCVMLSLCLPFLLSLGWVTSQFCVELYKAQVFILSHQFQMKSCGDSHPTCCSGIAQPLALGNKQQRSWSHHHHHEEDLFAVLVSRCWLTSFPGCRVCRQPLCPGKWSMHNCLTSQDHYHQLFLFVDPLERG